MEYKLSELFELQMGKTPSRNCLKYWNTNENKWISISDLSSSNKYITDTKEYISHQAVENSGIKPIPKNTVVMSFKLTIGKVAIVPEIMYSNEAIMAFIDKKLVEILPEYLYYLFLHKDWNAGTNKAVMGNTLNKATLSNVKISIHTVEKQKQIINVLNRTYAIIEKYKQELDKLDALVKARFVEMFGEFGSSRYQIKKLNECCIINPKKSTDDRLQDELEVSFVPMPAISEDGKMNTSETALYKAVKKGFTYFAENDVIFAKITPCMENGKGAVAKNLCNGIGFGSTEFHVLRPIETVTNPYWIYYLTVFKEFRLDAESKMTGSAGQRRVPASFLENYKVSVPPIELQNEFADFVKQIDKSKVVVQKALDEAQLLFDSLMQEYFG